MNLPKSVQAQTDAADAARSSAYEGEPEPTTSKAAQPAVEPEPKQEQKQQEPETRDAAYWRHRFEVLQGKYNAEVKVIPALRQEIAELKAKLEERPKGEGSASDMKAALLEGLPEGVVDEYGPDLIDAIAKIAANAAGASKSAPASSEIETLKNQVNSMSEERRQERQAQMMADLERAVPEWQQLQSSQPGQDWLLAHDRTTGKVRNDILVQAAEQFQTQTVINLFQDMKSDISPKQPPASQVQPKQSRSTTQVPAGGQTYTRADINQFYKDRTQGKYTDEQAVAIEEDFLLAATEGRIIG